MIRSLYIGRFQPFHEGHRKFVQTLLDEGKFVLIALRRTEIDANNPYTVEERKEFIAKYFKEPEVKVIAIPDISEVCYGRGVGYSVREIRLDEATESISATKIRAGLIDPVTGEEIPDTDEANATDIS